VGANSCASPEPPWASPGTGIAGEATLSGAPAQVKRAGAPPVMDGKLDDAIWMSATQLGPWVDPSTGADAPRHKVAGWAKVAWDDRNLYVGAVVRDQAPTTPFLREQVDPHIWSKASAIELMVQPGDPGDNRDYYEIQVDVGGAIFDTHWDDYNVPIRGVEPDRVFGHVEWSCRAERAVHVHKKRFYSVEIAMPWSALLAGRTPIPPRTGDVWRLNLYSFRDGQAQALAWSPIRGQGNFHRSSRFGRIRFE
jgi:hypothetical protein